jgi:hypothetical protein
VRLDHLLSKELSHHGAPLAGWVLVVRPTPRPSASGVVLMGGTSAKTLAACGPAPVRHCPLGGGGWIGLVRVGWGLFGTLLGPEGAGQVGLVASADHRKAFPVGGVVMVGLPVA